MPNNRFAIIAGAVVSILVGCGGESESNTSNYVIIQQPDCPSSSQKLEIDDSTPSGVDFTMTAPGAIFTFQKPSKGNIALRVCFGRVDLLEQNFPDFEGVVRLSEVYELRAYPLKAPSLPNSLKNLVNRKMEVDFPTDNLKVRNIFTDLKNFVLTENGLIEENLGNFNINPVTGVGEPLVNEDGSYFIGFTTDNLVTPP